MKRFLKIAIAYTAALAAMLLTSTSCPAAIVNGSFETGDLTGWSASSSLAAADTSEAKLFEAGTWTPTAGSWFAHLYTGGGPGVYTTLSQTFTALAGETLTLDVFYDAGDYLPFLDDGYVSIASPTTTLFARSVADVGDYGSTPWTAISHTFLADGIYTLEVGVRNTLDNANPSAIGIDNVALSASTGGDVPEPTSFVLFGAGALGLVAARSRRRRLQ